MNPDLLALIRRHREAENAHDLEGILATLRVGRFLGIEPTGRPIVQPFMVVLSFRDELMLGERFHYDLASLVRQIGADPIPALAGLDYRKPAVAAT